MLKHTEPAPCTLYSLHPTHTVHMVLCNQAVEQGQQLSTKLGSLSIVSVRLGAQKLSVM